MSIGDATAAAELFKSLSHVTRLMILETLLAGPKCVSDIEDLLAQGIDYLVVNPVDEAGIVPAIEAANQANVPVITIDRAAICYVPRNGPILHAPITR